MTGATTVVRARRRGSLLLELVLVMGVSSVLMSIAAISVHHLLVASNRVRNAAHDAMIQQRLVAALRADARTASNVTTEDESVVLQTASGGSITWTASPKGARREWREGNAAGREDYRFLNGGRVAIELISVDPEQSADRRAVAMLRLTIDRPRGERRSRQTRTIIAEARIGRGPAVNSAPPPGDRQ